MPILLQYLVPGGWCLLLFNFSTSKKNNSKSTLIVSCLFSYILLAIVSLLRVKWFSILPNNAIVNSGLAIIIGTVIVSIIAVLLQRKWVKKLFIKMFHKTLNDNIWKDILDLDNGSNLKIYLKNKEYYIIGQLKNFEENGELSWIALKAFAKRDKSTNQNFKSEPSFLNRPEITIAVRLSDVEHIEIF